MKLNLEVSSSRASVFGQKQLIFLSMSVKVLEDFSNLG